MSFNAKNVTLQILSACLITLHLTWLGVQGCHRVVDRSLSHSHP